jgi:pyruvate/2-oxoglutarate dehydrogenase complex dihydrolipoamide acyltransferase (E2) component
MRLEYKLPKLADTADNYVVLEWRVAVGDRVRQGQPFVLIETDKTEIELDVPADGIVVELLVAVDDEVTTGQTICVIDTDA